ncbi:hypothetical protein RRG08_043952 [Elysia crispata]|uniref:Uncharacterized protein n=1 Tax=Elysia crispata TaxID=231223 RepID=A0AAE0Y088_9GAST|nr:hypothetical protein RRG08_043952 [Elysia crispata]
MEQSHSGCTGKEKRIRDLKRRELISDIKVTVSEPDAEDTVSKTKHTVSRDKPYRTEKNNWRSPIKPGREGTSSAHLLSFLDKKENTY